MPTMRAPDSLCGAIPHPGQMCCTDGAFLLQKKRHTALEITLNVVVRDQLVCTADIAANRLPYSTDIRSRNRKSAMLVMVATVKTGVLRSTIPLLQPLLEGKKFEEVPKTETPFKELHGRIAIEGYSAFRGGY